MTDQHQHQMHTPSERGRGHHRARAALLVAAVFALVATGCSSDWDAAPVFEQRAVGVSVLRAVEDCDDLAQRSRDTLELAVDRMWASYDEGTTSDGAMDSTSGQGFAAEESADAGAASAAPPSAASRAADASRESTPGEVIGTNTQEQSVDEPDLVKTDGRRIVTITDGMLRVVELDDDPSVDGLLDLRGRAATEMFLRGDEAVIIGTSAPMGFREDGVATSGDLQPGATDPGTVEPGIVEPDTLEPGGDEPGTIEPAPPTTGEPAPPTSIDPGPPVTIEPAPPTTGVPPAPMPVPFRTGTSITVVDLAGDAPTVRDSTDVEGDYLSARMVDGRVRMVLRGEPQVTEDLMMSTDESSARAAVAAIDGTELLPRRVADGSVQPLGDCADVVLLATESGDGDGEDASGTAMSGASRGVAVDSSFAPMGLSTITTLSIGATLDDLQPVTIQGNAETVYASTGALYVTAGGWDEDGSHTGVHRFALPADGPATHTGSGRVPGRLLNQFSLSERDGALRVVTTVDGMAAANRDGSGPGPDMAIAPATAGRLTVLDTEGDTLDEIGHVDGLGLGEEVKSVRFVGDLGYVVTFRTTDPLYALDLSDPRAPRLLGELKIPGFSEYLHPVGDGLLLGVGREADPTTGMETGAKVSLFDISDPAAMVEVDQVVVPDGWSPVGSDHRAFLWDEGRGQAVVPMERPGAGGVAMVLRVRDGQLDVAAELRHGNEFGSTPLRSLVVDGDLWTVSMVGLGRTSADAPGAVDQLRF